MKYSALTFAFLAISFGSAASESDIETITIAHKQAFRGDIPLKELPQSITTLSKEMMVDNGITKFRDALDFSASISRKNNGGALWDSYSIRGLSGNENMPSGYLINGFSGGRGFAGPRDVSNIEYIEVLKGPGSALYGRSEPGGTINIITKKPQFYQQGQLKAELGSDNHKRVQGDYTNGLTDDIAFRVNGAWQDSDSFRDYVHHDKFVITPSLYYQLNDKSSLTYEFEYVDQQQMYDRGIVVLNNDFNTVPENRFLGNPNDAPTKVHSRGHQLNYSYDFDRDWSLLLGSSYRTATLTGYSSDAELSPSRQSLFDDGRTLTRQHRYRDYKSDDLSLRFELSGHFELAGITNHVLVGADAYDYELRTGLYRYRGGKGTYTIDIYEPDYGTEQGPDVEMQYENNEEQSAYGIYLQDQLDITERFKVMVGLRFDEIEQDIFETKSGVASNSKENRISPRFGMVYELNDAINLYTSYSEGFLPLSGTDAQGEPFGFEESDSFEVGLKFGFDDISGTIALFDASKSNMLVADPVNVGYSAPVGKATSKGVEVDVTGSLGANTEYTISYAYVKAETANDVVNVDWLVPIPKGSPLVNVPENNFSLSLNHDTRVFEQDIKIGGHYQYISDRLGDPADLTFRLPSYQLVGLFTKWQATQRMAVSLNLDNIFDETYIASSYNALWAYPGAPTQFKLGISYDF
ncbi:TonB-dependent siderophore receptor [Pseudoalteromonas prydzensis]|uniref:TonB-dependent siderophore receptor n=1 Tax=Pseudoalteromonas prydzensis TaxID=182141 RepID=UPI0007E51E86|nr:TonB-dependent siderophore receptor [Pseudoalteromonas prydzensis]MBE0377209.1 iron complex outermembrane recepter protein [Pseudoalteromonas prydzensis ACAM 620]